MSSIEGYVDQGLLNRTLKWVRNIDGIVEFDREQASISVFVAQRWHLDTRQEDDEATFLIALTITFWNWLDDRSDKHLQDETTLIDWKRLIGITEGNIVLDIPTSPEEIFLLHLCELIKQKAATEEEFHGWLRAFTPVLRGMQFEEQVARQGIAPSFVESLEYGVFSITALSVLSTFYLVNKMDRHMQNNNFVLSHLEHCFCGHQRILNDIKSADRERREGNGGYVSNLVLLLEKSLSPVLAQEFVLQQVYGYERLIVTNIEILGADNPFSQLIKRLFEITLEIYKSRFERY